MKSISWKHYVLYSVLIVLTISSFAFGIYKDKQSERYAHQIKMDYQRCFTEMVQYVDDLNLSLEKSKFVNDPGQMIRLSGEIYRQAAEASVNLALLPLKTEPLENLTEFLSQAGNYAYALSLKMLDGNAVTKEEYTNLTNLSQYARTVADSLDKDLEALYNGTLKIMDVGKDSAVLSIDQAMGEVNDQLHDYPALIYDGPFSAHLTDKKPLFIENAPFVTREDVIEKANNILGEDKGFEILEEEGNIPAYYLYADTVSMAFTKQGGYLLYYLNDREVGPAQLDIGSAKISALEFLENRGFENMSENYYETIGDVAVINFAPEENGYTLYPDLIKVKVALDTGEIVGCESRGYIMNHTYRQIPEIKISAEEARGKVNPNVGINSISLALIPLEDGTEAPCWQIETQAGDRRCLVYVNTLTGAEEKIFLLIESETGVLAV